jgi:hypothetical protein
MRWRFASVEGGKLSEEVRLLRMVVRIKWAEQANEWRR